MYVFMGHMKFEHTQPYENDFWKKNNINLVHKAGNRSVEERKSLYYWQIIQAFRLIN